MKRLLCLLSILSIFGLNFVSDEAIAASPALRVNGFNLGGKGPYVVFAHGAKCDGSTDDTTAIQAAVTAAQAAGGGIVYFPGGTCVITGTITLDNTVSLQGALRSGTTIQMNGTAFTSNAFIGKPVAFAISTNQTTNATTATGHARGGYVRNIFFLRNGDLNGSNASFDLIALNVGANMVIENNQFKNFWSSVYGAEGYVDEIHVRDAYFYYPHGTGWQIHLGYLGDGHIIEGLSFDQTTSPGGSVYLNGNRGALLSNLIAATVYVLNSEGVTISNLHGELQAQVTLDTCKGCKISDSIFYKRSTTTAPVSISWASADSSQRGLPDVLDNVQFISYGDIVSYKNDVQVSSQANLQIRNCFRRYQGNTGDVPRSIAMGIMLEDETATDLTLFNQRSNVLSKSSQIEHGQIRFHSDMEAAPARGFRIAGLSATSIAGTWLSSSATYFYSFDLIYNKVKGPISSADSGESSVALTNGGNGSLLTVNTGLPVGIFYRFWRGTSAGVYTAYVDIPVLGGIHFYDNGTTMNGYPWLTSSLPTRMLSYLPAHRESHDRFEAFDTAAPTLGTWVVQDTVWNTTPTSGGNMGWVCTAGGTPGTWVPFGVVNNTLTSPTINTGAVVSPTLSGTVAGTPTWSSTQTFPQIVATAGSGSQTGNVPVTVFRNATPVTSVTTGEIDAQSYTMPANTLNTDGQSLQCAFGFHHANNANATTAKFYFNGTAIQTLTSSGALQQTYGQFTLTRSDSATMRGLSMVAQDTSNVSKATGAVGVVWSGAIIIKTSLTGATTNADLTADYLHCEWIP